MGKQLRSQRRGKGSFTFMATKQGRADVSYEAWNPQMESIVRGQVARIETDSGRTAVLARILWENGSLSHLIAAEGILEGQPIETGKQAGIGIGNVLPLESIPEGCPIFAIEKVFQDGGTLIRSAGLYGIVMSKTMSEALVKLPSGKTVSIPLACRATIGCVAGGGRTDKPLMRAGSKFHLMKARRRHYPGVRGVAQNPVNHPFGGSQHHAGKSKSTSRNAPPGRKVGAIASSRTGRRKR